MVPWGGASCTIFWSSLDILNRWPNLEYLPRPEPPREYSKAHGQWKKEYAQWKGLKCSRQKGAYFCRRHGRWITCVELEAGLAYPQHQEKDEGYQCPASHYEWEQMEKDFAEKQSAHLQDLEEQLAAPKAANDPGPERALESEFDQLNIGSAISDDRQDIYQQQQGFYPEPGADPHPYYASRSTYADTSTYNRPAGYSGDPPQYKQTSGRSGSRYSGKNFESRSSRSRNSRDSEGSKSTWNTYTTTPSSPTSESYYPQPIQAGGGSQANNLEHETVPYYGTSSYAGEEGEPETDSSNTYGNYYR